MDFFNVDDEKDAIILQGEEEDFESTYEDILAIVGGRRCAEEVDAELKHSISIRSSTSCRTQKFESWHLTQNPSKAHPCPNPSGTPSVPAPSPSPLSKSTPATKSPCTAPIAHPRSVPNVALYKSTIPFELSIAKILRTCGAKAYTIHTHLRNQHSNHIASTKNHANTTT